jgi:hypothetical protein
MSPSHALTLIMSISVNLSEALMTLVQGGACLHPGNDTVWYHYLHPAGRELDLPPLKCAIPATCRPLANPAALRDHQLYTAIVSTVHYLVKSRRRDFSAALLARLRRARPQK